MSDPVISFVACAEAWVIQVAALGGPPADRVRELRDAADPGTAPPTTADDAALNGLSDSGKHSALDLKCSATKRRPRSCVMQARCG